MVVEVPAPQRPSEQELSFSQAATVSTVGKTEPATVSLCMIVRNEEANLAACLRPSPAPDSSKLAAVFWEMHSHII